MNSFDCRTASSRRVVCGRNGDEADASPCAWPSARGQWPEWPFHWPLRRLVRRPSRRIRQTGPLRPATCTRPRSGGEPVPYRCAPRLAAASVPLITSRTPGHGARRKWCATTEIRSWSGGHGLDREARLWAVLVPGLQKRQSFSLGNSMKRGRWPGSLFERQQHTFQQHLVEAHRDELFFGVGPQRNPVPRYLDTKLAQRTARTSHGRRPLRRAQSGSRPRDTLIARTRPYGNEHNGEAGSLVGMIVILPSPISN